MPDLKIEEIPLHIQTNFYLNFGEEMKYDFETYPSSNLLVVPPKIHSKTLEELHDNPGQNTTFMIPAKNLSSTGVFLHIKVELALDISKKLTDFEQKSLLYYTQAGLNDKVKSIMTALEQQYLLDVLYFLNKRERSRIALHHSKVRNQ